MQIHVINHSKKHNYIRAIESAKNFSTKLVMYVKIVQFTFSLQIIYLNVLKQKFASVACGILLSSFYCKCRWSIIVKKTQLHRGYRVHKKLFHQMCEVNIGLLTSFLQINEDIIYLILLSYNKQRRPKAPRISSIIIAVSNLQLFHNTIHKSVYSQQLTFRRLIIQVVNQMACVVQWQDCGTWTMIGEFEPWLGSVFFSFHLCFYFKKNSFSCKIFKFSML